MLAGVDEGTQVGVNRLDVCLEKSLELVGGVVVPVHEWWVHWDVLGGVLIGVECMKEVYILGEGTPFGEVGVEVNKLFLRQMIVALGQLSNELVFWDVVIVGVLAEKIVINRPCLW